VNEPAAQSKQKFETVEAPLRPPLAEPAPWYVPAAQAAHAQVAPPPGLA